MYNIDMWFEILKVMSKKGRFQEENPPTRWRNFLTPEDRIMILASA